MFTQAVSSREPHGGEHRTEVARFPQIETSDDFDFTCQRLASRREFRHPLTSSEKRTMSPSLGPPGTGRTHFSIALGTQATFRDYRVSFASSIEWVLRLSQAKTSRETHDEHEWGAVVFCRMVKRLLGNSEPR